MNCCRIPQEKQDFRNQYANKSVENNKEKEKTLVIVTTFFIFF